MATSFAPLPSSPSGNLCTHPHSSSRKRKSSSPLPRHSFTSSSSPEEPPSATERKRSRTHDPTSTSTPLKKYLQVLDHSQLVSILLKLPAPVLSGLLEKPTVANVESYLGTLEKKLAEVWPYHKYGMQTDEYAFNRVRPILYDIRDTLLEFAAYFEGEGQVYTVASYLHIATRLIFRLPDWKEREHADLKQGLVLKMSGYWRRCMGHAVSSGRLWGEEAILRWTRSLREYEELASSQRHYFTEAREVLEEGFSWMIRGRMMS